MRGPAQYLKSPVGADETQSRGSALGARPGWGWLHALPCLLHVLVLLLMAGPSLTDPGPKIPAPSLAGLSVYEAGEHRASADIPKMARAGNDADDLREDFVVAAPRPLPVSATSVAVDPTGGDKPDTRDDHPPDRPPRHRA